MKNSRPGCATPNMTRPSQPHFNPPPGATPEAATAAKKDMAKRETGGITGALKAAYNKLTSNAPTAGSNTSAASMADKKDQSAKLKNE